MLHPVDRFAVQRLLNAEMSSTPDGGSGVKSKFLDTSPLGWLLKSLDVSFDRACKALVGRHWGAAWKGAKIRTIWDAGLLLRWHQSDLGIGTA